MKLLGGVLLLLGVLLVQRGLHKPPRLTQRMRLLVSGGQHTQYTTTGRFDLAKWREVLDRMQDDNSGDQGGWPTHDGGAA